MYIYMKDGVDYKKISMYCDKALVTQLEKIKY